ncbi:hypothetical protein ACGFX4_31715 [Kitasatospora sp. NPDC048365]|uniref:hypothetical protein n=1 Tax=Kitasatospora sp. NPDC048365 TaxID=3364050 RepID=UPI0037217B9C
MHPNEFEVWYRAEKFTPPIPSPDRLVFTADALAHALFVTGRAPGDRTAHGLSSVYEWLHRVALVPAYVRRTPTGRIARSDLARELDRSEKGALSYALGQAMTGIFSEQAMDVRFLMHVDRYSLRYNLQFAAGTKQRADLFGEKQHGGWVVAEAKGRSGNISSDLALKMWHQKRTVRTVQGQPPDPAYGCAAYFPRQAKGTPEPLALYVVDPDEDEVEAIDLRVDPDQFVLAYYEPLLTAIEAGERQIGASEFRTSSFGQFRLTVGILEVVAQRIERARDGDVRNLHRDVSDLLETYVPRSRPSDQFLDGTVMTTQWQENLSLNDWSGYQEESDHYPRF